MRSGTRKVADSKPDAPTTSKEGDAIQMDYIGTLFFSLPLPLPDFFLRKSFDFVFIFSTLLFLCFGLKKFL